MSRYDIRKQTTTLKCTTRGIKTVKKILSPVSHRSIKGIAAPHFAKTEWKGTREPDLKHLVGQVLHVGPCRHGGPSQRPPLSFEM